eukprot:3723825-Lingulodinium_polyedra.AAC.1
MKPSLPSNASVHGHSSWLSWSTSPVILWQMLCCPSASSSSTKPSSPRRSGAEAAMPALLAGCRPAQLAPCTKPSQLCALGASCRMQAC